MSVVGLIVAIAIIVLLVWLAPKFPAPVPIIIYSILAIICIVYLLSLFGLIGGPLVIRS